MSVKLSVALEESAPTGPCHSYMSEISEYHHDYSRCMEEALPISISHALVLIIGLLGSGCVHACIFVCT